MNRHQETFIFESELGKEYPSYMPTYDFKGEYIDKTHKEIAAYPLKDNALIQVNYNGWFRKIIPGWLRCEDALKLYELCFFSSGDVLEIGSYYGLSTYILGLAACNTRDTKNIYSVEIEPAFVKQTEKTLKNMMLEKYVKMICNDSISSLHEFSNQNKKFNFIFIDHSHTYQSVFDVCRELSNVISPGGFCLFHDFNDPRNTNPDEKDYNVYQAVIGGLKEEQFEFWGVYGCTGLYRFKG